MKKTAVVLVAILIAACASAPKVETSKAQTSETGAASSANAAPAITAAAAPAAELESQKLASEAQALQNQSAYFDFDSSEIKDEYRNVILQQADFIKAHANDVVTVQGNCDERGSSEYNLGLGSERANAARSFWSCWACPQRKSGLRVLVRKSRASPATKNGAGKRTAGTILSIPSTSEGIALPDGSRQQVPKSEEPKS